MGKCIDVKGWEGTLMDMNIIFDGSNSVNGKILAEWLKCGSKIFTFLHMRKGKEKKNLLADQPNQKKNFFFFFVLPRLFFIFQSGNRSKIEICGQWSVEIN